MDTPSTISTTRAPAALIIWNVLTCNYSRVHLLIFTSCIAPSHSCGSPRAQSQTSELYEDKDKRTRGEKGKEEHNKRTRTTKGLKEKKERPHESKAKEKSAVMS